MSEYETGKHEPTRLHLYGGATTVILALVWLIVAVLP